MTQGRKKFHKIFANASLGFALLAGLALPRATSASSSSTVKRDAASAQFSKAEDQRAALNHKTPDKRTLAEYKRVINSYRRVYIIAPDAVQVPEALLAVAELNTEMGDRFGRSYYQAAVDSYELLLREYPTSKYVQDARLHVAKLQKDQLDNPVAATKSFQEFQEKYPHSPHKREVQEALAELALLKNAETGNLAANIPPTAPVAEKLDVPIVAVHMAASGGESAKGGEVPRVQNIKAHVTPDSTEVVIELEDTVQYVSRRILNPDRIYFDLHAVRLSPAVARGDVRVSGDLLTRVRVAQNQAGIVRVVLDVNGVQDYAATLLNKPTRLVIELYASSHLAKPDSVQTARANGAVKAKAAENQPAGEPVIVVAASQDTVSAKAVTTWVMAANSAPASSSPPTVKHEPAPSESSLTGSSKTKPDLVVPALLPQPTHDGQSTLTRALGLKINRIVIDPGHGGHDTGTIGPTGMMEKDLCLDVALRLGKLIRQKLPGADIVYTRSDDTFIPLEERTDIANEAKADLFISIHANSSPDRDARGVETYYLNLKGSPEAMEVAARENASALENIHELEDLVKKITRTEKIDESKELAADVQDSLSRRMQKAAKPVKNRGVRKAPFVVLIGADMPSILTEISFLSNPSDEQLLKKPEHRQRVAEGLFAGFTAYLQSLNSMAVNSSGKPSRPVVVPVEQSRK
ncbi:MAG: N-acetylmuramoyl-L-alanine amidase [Candidatus Acidiferrum sp.]